MQINTKYKQIIITGAANGLGKNLVEQLIDSAEKIHLIDKDAQSLEEQKNRYQNKVEIYVCDITSENESKKLIENLVQNNITYDLLINCAGIGSHKTIAELSFEDIQKLTTINCIFPTYLTTALVSSERLKANSKIVNIGSISGDIVLPSLALYSSSKAFLHTFTRSMGMELQHTNINALLVILGSLSDTKFGDNLNSKYSDTSKFYSSLKISAKTAASEIVKAINSNTKELVFPRYVTLVIALDRLFPTFFRGIATYIFNTKYNKK